MDCGYLEKRMMKHSRDEAFTANLKNRINKVVGQLQGITRMIDDNRYCSDILIQLAASKQALKVISYMLLDEHMKTCVAEDLKAGDLSSLEEALDLSKKLS